jgi:hypothetical protein
MVDDLVLEFRIGLDGADVVAEVHSIIIKRRKEIAQI